MALLASAHRLRYEDTSDPASLRCSLALHERLLSVTPADAEVQHAVAADLLALDAWTNDAAALDRAVSLAYEAAVSGDALESNVRLYLLLTSATAYHTRYDRTADPDTLAMAQAIVARVVEEVGEDHPLSGAAAHLLGTILQRRYHRSGADVDLHAALVCLRTAAELEDTPVHLADLVDALRLRASLESDDSLRIEAFSVSERAAGLPRRRPPTPTPCCLGTAAR
jgi:hypothetical protein